MHVDPTEQMMFAGSRIILMDILTIAEPQRIKVGDAGLLCAGLSAHGNPFLLALDPVHCKAASRQALYRGSMVLRCRSSREHFICAVLVLDALACHQVQENI